MVAQLNMLLINVVFAFLLHMMFNAGMDISKVDHPDWALIVRHGGPAKVARLLGYEANGGTQRVQNWRYRGVPAEVKIAFPEIFLSDLVRRRHRSSADAARDSAGANLECVGGGASGDSQ